MHRITCIIKFCRNILASKPEIESLIDYFIDPLHRNHIGVEMTSLRLHGPVKSVAEYVSKVLEMFEVYRDRPKSRGRPASDGLAEQIIYAPPTGCCFSDEERNYIQDYIASKLGLGGPVVSTVHLGCDGRDDFHFLVPLFSSRDLSRRLKTILEAGLPHRRQLYYAREIWSEIIEKINEKRKLIGNGPIEFSASKVRRIDKDTLEANDLPRVFAHEIRKNGYPSKVVLTKESLRELAKVLHFKFSETGRNTLSIKLPDGNETVRLRWTELIDQIGLLLGIRQLPQREKRKRHPRQGPEQRGDSDEMEL